MNPGKRFETDWKSSMTKDDLWSLRIRDNAMSYVESGSSFTRENPYDFLCFKMPNLFCFELKHTNYPSMSIQVNENEPKNKMIKWHQINELKKASRYPNVYAGLVLSFYNEKTELESTFYISIDNFIDFLDQEQKKSINMIDIVRYHGVRVSQTKLRTHYKYDIVELLDNISR